MPHRRLLAALVAAGALAAPILGSSAAASPPAAGSGTKTIVGVAASDPQFSTLVKLVKSAGLAGTLSKGSYTVFAPTNAAFAKVPKSTLAALGKDKAKLRAVLLYHVVKGRVPASSVVKLTSAKTSTAPACGSRSRAAASTSTRRARCSRPTSRRPTASST